MDSTAKRRLLAAYSRLLRPLIKILIRNGVSFSELSEVAKETYVHVASTDFKVPHRKMSQARIAILTGLTRKEVNRLTTKREGEEDQFHKNVNRVVRVLAGWHTDSGFTGPYGIPLELPFEDKKLPDFRGLVQKFSGDMSPRAMLDELLRVGAVVETDAGYYKALTRFYLPEGIAPDSLDHLAQSVKNYVTTIDNNIIEENSNKKLFERQVYTEDGIKPEDLPRFTAYVKERAKLLLEEIDNWLSQLEKPDSKNDDDIVSTGLGIYHYIDDAEDE